MFPTRVPLYRVAQEQLKEYIQTHKLRAGDALPPEGVLAGELGMSRLSLREATKSLASLGILEARQGEGIYVKAFTFDPILENLPYGLFVHGKSLEELFQVRHGLEEGLAGMVIDRVQPADLEVLDRLVEDMARCAARGEPVIAPDRDFHLQLFRPLDNQLVLRLIELFWEAYHRLRREVAGHAAPTDPARVHAIHAAIVDALRSRDRDRVRAAMVAHFATIPPGIVAPDGASAHAGMSRPGVPDLTGERTRA